MNTGELLEKYFDVAFAAPDGIKKLRELILSLAMQGKLVPQDGAEQPAELLKEIACKENYLSAIKLEECKSLLPTTWRWVRVGYIFELKSGYSFPKDEELQSGTYMYLKVGEMNAKGNEIVITSTSIFLNESTRVINALIPKNSIIFPKRGGAIATNKKRLVIEPICVDTNIMAIICPKNIDLNFVYHWILSIDLAKLNSGTSVPQINNKDIYPLLFPLPPLAEQCRIVAKIDELMARCDELEKLKSERDRKQITIHKAALNRLLTAKDHSDFQTSWHFITQHFSELYSVKENVAELRKAILQLAVMGKLVPQDPSDQPASELLKEVEAEKETLVKTEKIKTQKLIPPISSEEITYELPKTWEWVRMDDLCLGITSGSTPPNHIFSDTEGIPFLKVYNIRNQKVDFQYKPQFISEEYHLKSKRSCLKSGDVIMNIVGPPLGKVAIVPDEFSEYNCNQAIVFFRPIIKSLNKYLYLYLLSGKFLDKIDLIGTAGQDNISITKSRTIPIPLPPIEQQRIVAKIDQLMPLCDELEKQIDAAKSKQTNLLNSLMTSIAKSQT